MSGYTSGCDHIGEVWEPPTSDVQTVPCAYCGTAIAMGCRDRKGALTPHAIRYIAYHDASCRAVLGSDAHTEQKGTGDA